MRIGKYEIDPTALEKVPQSLALDRCVLPLRFEGDDMHVVLGQRDPTQLAEVLDQLVFIFNCTYCYTLDDYSTLAKIVNIAYHASSTRVSQCVHFEVLCEKQWLDLHETADPTVRHCDTCEKSVFWAETGEKAMAYAQLGRCVALAGSNIEYIESMGMIDPDYVPPQYGVRLMFQWGRGFLWPLDNETRTVFGEGPIEDQLPLLPATLQRLQMLSAWHAQSLNPDDPSEPGPWTPHEQAAFENAAWEVLELVRQDLGDVFTVDYVWL